MSDQSNSRLLSIAWKLGATGAAIAVGSACGLGLSSACVSALGPAYADLGQIMSGVAGGLSATELASVADRLRGSLRKRPVVTGNHHLARIVGDSISRAILLAGARLHDQKQVAILGVMANQAPKTWTRIVHYPGVAGLSQEDANSIVKEYVEALQQPYHVSDKPSPLSHEQWKAVLQKVAKDARLKPTAPGARALDAAGRLLGEQFSDLLLRCLTEDREAGGDKYPELHLLVITELLASSSKAIQNVANNLETIEKLVRDSFTSLSTTAKLRHGALFARIKEIGGGLDSKLGRLAARLEELSRQARISIPLDTYIANPGTGRNLAALLHPRNQRVPLTGRDEELERLVDWLAEPLDVSIRVISGIAGIGKTRLAVELVRVASRSGWAAGFCRSTALQSFAADHPELWTWDEPHLLVVDYASSQTQGLERLLDNLAGRRTTLDDLKSLRILLIDRHDTFADSGVGRLLEPRAGDLGNAIAEWHDASRDISLSSIESEGTLRELLKASLDSFRDDASTPEGANNALSDLLAAQLEGLRLDQTPLLIQLAALFHAELQDSHLTSREDLLSLYWTRERRDFLENSAERFGIDAELLTWSSLAACLRLGTTNATVEATMPLITQACSLIGNHQPPPTNKALGALIDYLGTDSGNICALEPDLLAEYALVASLQGLKASTSAKSRWLVNQVGDDPIPASQFLSRCAEDFPNTEPLHSILREHAKTRAWPLVALMVAESALPRRSIALADLAIDFNTAVLESLPHNSLTALERARLLMNLGSRKSDIGAVGEAATLTNSALEILRSLPREIGSPVLPLFVSALNNQSQDCLDSGNVPRSVQLSDEALQIYRDLSDQAPSYRPGLAHALNTRSVILFHAGRHEEALQCTQESVHIYRDLHSTESGAFLAELAASLDNLGVRLVQFNRNEEALELSREALQYWRVLANARPDSHSSDLSLCLNNLGNRFYSVGQAEDAIAAVEEAVKIRRKLASALPYRYSGDLSQSLLNLARFQWSAKRSEASVAASSSAVTATGVARGVLSTPNALSCAANLLGMALLYAEANLHDAAVTVTRGAVDLLIKLPPQATPAALHLLGIASGRLGSLHASKGRYAEAANCTAHALREIRKTPPSPMSAIEAIAVQLARDYVQYAGRAGLAVDFSLVT